MSQKFLTKEQLISQLQNLALTGWVKSVRPLNSGGIGNTIDAVLGVRENNLPIADTSQWELKTHRIGSSSLLTLLHTEPEPRDKKIVVNVLIPKYGWPDQTRLNELSFRQTIQAGHASDRGFSIVVNRTDEKVMVYFNAAQVDSRHSEWLATVNERVGLGQLEPQPYWGFKELFFKAQSKLLNAFYVESETKRENNEEYFKLIRVQILQGFDIERFVKAIENGMVLVDFDARTHHNHGTKFRLRQEAVPQLYRYVDIIPLTEATGKLL